MENEGDKLLKIGELAKLAGVSVKALHVYEKKNVIKPVWIDENTGYRYYSPDQFRLVEALIGLQDMGFSLDEISKILSGKCSKEEISSMFDEKELLLQERIYALEAKIKELSSIKKNMNEGSEANRIKEMSDEERARLLAKLVVINEEGVRQTLSEVLWL
ncbi:MAG: MerR family transcriptional regulator [Lachnospiraceae bacterium]|nr:MerR family transcriptional regulator [Lachnospiraceae bacterium]